ncbi:ATP-binding cassette domain-containing protein [Companilactobacillus alimentarius]|uniref:ATP-binding cassette domain-containing protein n=1 Tax=Companilactobacillus alimentarius TaxID=1602 RepID=UPI0028B5AEBD|nr:ATP-binding cassette domain-containing protein [Companilactobacillus alimentarius]MDT6953045.1 ATP-binding cassette domain-containing protein [Companilactobacillus alimentarius]
MAEIMKLLSVNDLSLQNEGYFAFKHVAFSLSQNEIVGINGDNGSGKTQLLEAIADNKSVDSGKIQYTPGVRIGYLPRNDPQVIEQTVRKYLEEVRRLSKKLAVRSDQLESMVTYLKLAPYLDRSISQLSLGLQRRVGFIAAVAGHPNVLLLDEPFIFQPNEIVQGMASMLQDLKDNGSGIIISQTEFSSEMQLLLDQGYQLKNGALIKSVLPKKTDYLLVFHINPNSIAITHEITPYIVKNANNLLEMRVPVNLKDIMVGKMIALNYQFEEAEEIES